MVPVHLVPHNWSLIHWSLWNNGSQPIQSPWTNGPQKLGPHGQMVPYQFGPPWSPFFQWDQILWDHLFMGTKFDEDHLSRGINFSGTVYPGGQEVGTGSMGIKWVWDQMCRSL